VSASHGGVSSGEFALAFPLTAVFFNDGPTARSTGPAGTELLLGKRRWRRAG
jgi:hypothetical protein